jgi:hypothetical protein
MVLFLISDVFYQDRQMRRANGESAIAVLPIERVHISELRLYPSRRTFLQFGDQLGHTKILGEAAQDVDMVFDAPHDERGAILIITNAFQVNVHPLTDEWVFKKWAPIFRGEYDVEVNLRQ